jgi:2-dehydropantoate 2-reductase
MLSAVMPVRLTENLWGFLWAKTCYASLLFATALTDETIYDVVEHSHPIQRMLVRLVAEAMAVAEASGVRLESFDEYEPALYRRGASGDDAAVREAMTAVSRFYRVHTKVKSGIWRDLAVRKRKTEVDSQPGMVAEKGKALGISTPLTARLVQMIHEREDGTRPMGWANLEELAALAG